MKNVKTVLSVIFLSLMFIACAPDEEVLPKNDIEVIKANESTVGNNPLYEGNENSGTNPIYRAQ